MMMKREKMEGFLMNSFISLQINVLNVKDLMKNQHVLLSVL